MGSKRSKCVSKHAAKGSKSFEKESSENGGFPSREKVEGNRGESYFQS